ncbi:MAG: hypothetical protein CM15mP58_18600 [Burkholderiaceae bacterium]|nr:MAG: hypothetical protein CM15mP58_18600 [Burkholderiaceae bacterium]
MFSPLPFQILKILSQGELFYFGNSPYNSAQGFSNGLSFVRYAEDDASIINLYIFPNPIINSCEIMDRMVN